MAEMEIKSLKKGAKQVVTKKKLTDDDRQRIKEMQVRKVQPIDMDALVSKVIEHLKEVKVEPPVVVPKVEVKKETVIVDQEPLVRERTPEPEEQIVPVVESRYGRKSVQVPVMKAPGSNNQLSTTAPGDPPIVKSRYGKK